MRIYGWQWYRRDGTRALVVRALVPGEWKVLKVCWDTFDRRVNYFEVNAITQFVQSRHRRSRITGGSAPVVTHRTNFTSGVCTSGFRISGPTTVLARSDRCLLVGGGIVRYM